MGRRLPAALVVLLVTGLSVSRADLTAPIVPTAPIAEHVVIVSIDGLRPDAIAEAGAVNLSALIRRGAYCPTAQTVRPSITLSGHTSMLTGLDTWRHGVRSNERPPGHVGHPTIFSLARRAGLSTAMFFSKVSLDYLADPGTLDTVFGPVPGDRAPGAGAPGSPPTTGAQAQWAVPQDVTPERLAAAFAEAWERRAYALSFAHIREPDSTGHRHGWMSPAYLEAVRAADRAVGGIVEAVTRAGVIETTAIMVTADHGGARGTRRHSIRADPGNPENVTIPWICAGPGIPPGTVIDRVIRVYDTAATALAFLGIPAPPGIDGRPVMEVLRRRSLRPPVPAAAPRPGPERGGRTRGPRQRRPGGLGD
jgi:arylsulfatase A-like enzyme